MRKYLLCCVLALGACRTQPVAPVAAPVPVDRQAAAQKRCAAVRGPASSEVAELLDFNRAVQQMTAADLAKALSDLNLKPRSARIVVQKAMLLAALRSNGDLLRAQNLLDQLLKSTAPDAECLKPLVYLLNANYGEWRRLDDSVEKLNQQVRDSQKRIEQLSDTLEALKNIERMLPAPPGAASP
ncbi:MAG: hypothetical protein ACHP7O_11495 [Burkholderiales bacterium]